MGEQAFPFRVVSPGRVNLLGEHVDYNGGPVLPAAIDLHVQLDFAPRDDSLLEIQATDMGSSCRFLLDSLEHKVDIDGLPLPGWALYPAGVAWSLANRGIPLRGLNARYTSTVPVGSGLSSSAAVEVAFAAAWNHLAGTPLDRATLALLCQQAENRYVGVNCGIMDQFACANGVESHLLLLDTRDLEFHPVPLPPGLAIVIADSRIRRKLDESAYNDRRSGCEQAFAILSESLPGIRTLRDVSVAQFNRFNTGLPEPVRSYARHVVEECERVDRAAGMLAENDSAGFGQLMYACHASLRDLYRVSIPELDTLVELAARIPGCLGARLTGAGFGGCTVNLVTDEMADGFITELKTGYLAATGREAFVYRCKASAGVQVFSN